MQILTAEELQVETQKELSDCFDFHAKPVKSGQSVLGRINHR